MDYTKEQILKQMEEIKVVEDIHPSFTYIGQIEAVYPDLPAEVLECYRTQIWEWKEKNIRIATSDFGNQYCGFVCEGTPSELVKHLPGQD